MGCRRKLLNTTSTQSLSIATGVWKFVPHTANPTPSPRARTLVSEGSYPQRQEYALAAKVLDSQCGGQISKHLLRLIDFALKSYLKVSVDNPSRVRTSLIYRQRRRSIRC